MGLYKTLKQELLGQFDLKHTTTIFLAPNRTKESIGYVVIHEETHRKMCSSTTFGFFQMVLAYVSTNDKLYLPASLKNCLKILSLSIKESWDAHEGYAVYREHYFGDTFHIQKPPPIPPHEYAQAYTLFQNISKALSPSLQAMRLPIIHEIAHACFNTNILGSLPLVHLTEQNVKKYFEGTWNSPSNRLRSISAKLSKHGLSLDGEHRLLSGLNNILQRHYPNKNISIASYMKSRVHTPWERNCETENGINKLFSGVIADEIHLHYPDMYIPEIHAVENALHTYVEQSNNFLSTYGVSLPTIKKATILDASVDAENVLYDISDKFNELILPEEEARKALPFFLKWDLLFAWEIGAFFTNPLKEIYGDSPVYFLHLFPGKIKRDIKHPSMPNIKLTQVRLTMDKFSYFGSWSMVKDMIYALSGKTIAKVIHPSLINHKTWMPSPDIRNLFSNSYPVTVFMTTRGPNILKAFKEWRELGVSAVIPSGTVGNDSLHYYLVELTNGLHILLKLSLTMEGIIKIHYPDISKWKESLTPLKEDLIQVHRSKAKEGIHLDALTQLDKLGAFYWSQEHPLD